MAEILTEILKLHRYKGTVEKFLKNKKFKKKENLFENHLDLIIEVLDDEYSLSRSKILNTYKSNYFGFLDKYNETVKNILIKMIKSSFIKYDEIDDLDSESEDSCSENSDESENDEYSDCPSSDTESGSEAEESEDEDEDDEIKIPEPKKGKFCTNLEDYLEILKFVKNPPFFINRKYQASQSSFVFTHEILKSLYKNVMDGHELTNYSLKFKNFGEFKIPSVFLQRHEKFNDEEQVHEVKHESTASDVSMYLITGTVDLRMKKDRFESLKEFAEKMNLDNLLLITEEITVE